MRLSCLATMADSYRSQLGPPCVVVARLPACLPSTVVLSRLWNTKLDLCPVTVYRDAENSLGVAFSCVMERRGVFIGFFYSHNYTCRKGRNSSHVSHPRTEGCTVLPRPVALPINTSCELRAINQAAFHNQLTCALLTSTCNPHDDPIIARLERSLSIRHHGGLLSA
jgi:hypothetical protein